VVLFSMRSLFRRSEHMLVMLQEWEDRFLLDDQGEGAANGAQTSYKHRSTRKSQPTPSRCRPPTAMCESGNRHQHVPQRRPAFDLAVHRLSEALAARLVHPRVV
jgi:hypothetical protein